MSNPIKIHLQFVNLPQYIVEPRNLRIRNRNRIPGPVVLLLSHHLRLLTQIIKSCLYLLHQAIEMAAESCERGAVEEEEALGGSARSCSRGGSSGGGGGGLLVMAQQGDLVVGQAELGIGDGIGW
jgi:hypothetical protein